MQEDARTKHDSAEIGVQKAYKPEPEIISKWGHTLPNGGYFIRWAEYDQHGKKQPWSESDKHCCYTMYPADAKLGFTDSLGNYTQHPMDMVDIIKPPLEELQDRIAELEAKLKERGSHE